MTRQVVRKLHKGNRPHWLCDDMLRCERCARLVRFWLHHKAHRTRAVLHIRRIGQLRVNGRAHALDTQHGELVRALLDRSHVGHV